MKKYLRTIVLILCCVFSSLVFYACEDNSKASEIISLDVNKTEATLFIGAQENSSEDFSVEISPFLVEGFNLEFFGYNSNFIDIQMKENSKTTFTIKAKDITGSEANTLVGVRIKNNPEVKVSINVKIKRIYERLETPTNVHYDEQNGYLTWDEESLVEDGLNGYTLKITEMVDGVETEKIVICPVNNYYRDFDRNKVLSVQVMANGKINQISSDYSNTYTFKVLESVKNFNHENYVLSWDKVNDIDHYEINIDDQQLLQVSKDDVSKNIKQYIVDAGEHNISIKAVAPSNNNLQCITFDSADSSLKLTKLSTPTNFIFSNNILTWDKVEMLNGFVADGYIVKQDGVELSQTKHISLNPLKENLSAGEHTYSIKSVGNGTTTVDSDYSTNVRVTKLVKPQSVYVQNGTLFWDRNSSASGYTIVFKGIVGDNSKQFDIPQPDESYETISFSLNNAFNGKYNVAIIYKGDGEYSIDSVESEPFEIEKLKAVNMETCEVTESEITWQAVENTNGYEVRLKQGENEKILNVFENKFVLPQDFEAGAFDILITAIGDNTKYITSETSNKKQALILQTPVLSVKRVGEDNVVTWNKVSNVQNYLVKIDNGEPINVNLDTMYKFDENYVAGLYNIEVQAIGGTNAGSYIGSFSSNYSDILTVEKLDIPTLFVQNGNLVCQNAENYQLFSQNLANGSINYSAKALGDVNNNQLNSEVSAVLNVWKLPNISNLTIQDGRLSWDSLSAINLRDEYKEVDLSAAVLQCKIKYNEEDEEIVSIPGNEIDFSLDSYLDGAYSVSLQYLGNSGNSGTLLLNGAKAVKTLEKLKAPTIKVKSGLTYMFSFNEKDKPGILYWEQIENANGYMLEVYSGSTLITSKDMKNKLEYQLDQAPGTYKVKIRAYGNKEDIVDSEYSQEITTTKLAKVSNVRLEDGKIMWNNPYNYNVSILNIKAPRVVYLVDINGVLYNPYSVVDLSNIGLDTLRELNELNYFEIGEDFKPGEYSVKIKIYPLNADLSISSQQLVENDFNDLIGEESNVFTFKKLAAPLGLRTESTASIDHILKWNVNDYNNVAKFELVINYGENNEEVILINKGSANKFDDTTYYYDFSSFIASHRAESYKIKLRNIPNDETKYLASNYTDEFTINILSFGNALDANNDYMRIEDGKLVWTPVVGVKYYTFSITVEDLENVEHILQPISVNKNASSYEITLNNNSGFIAGTYTIRVMAHGDNISNYNPYVYFDALEESVFTFKKLKAPSELRVEKGVVVFEGTDYDFDSYLIYVENIATGQITQVNNGKQLSYELENKFGQGNYQLRVQALGSNLALNSEISLNIQGIEYAEKLGITSFNTDNGLLKWKSVSHAIGYLIEISGSSFISGEEVESGIVYVQVNGANYIDLSKKITDIDGNEHTLGAGQYTIRIKALGNSTIYLNGNYSASQTFIKLKTPTNLYIENGKVYWQDINTDYDVVEDFVVFTKLHDQTTWNQTIISKENSNLLCFEFGEDFETGVYDIKVQVKGLTQLSPTQNDVLFITGNESEVLENIEKLPVLENLRIEYSSIENVVGVLKFDDILGQYPNAEYLITFEVTKNGYVNEFSVVQTSNVFNITNYIITPSSDIIELDENTLINIKVKAIGLSYYLDGEYTADQDQINVTIPKNIDGINFVMSEIDSSVFTGKIEWNPVEYATKYVVKYYYLSFEDANALGIESANQIDWSQLNITPIEVETAETCAYVLNRGYYSFKVVPIIEYQSQSSEKSKISADETKVEYTETKVYFLFEFGNGTELDPFIVDSTLRFMFVKYNLHAHYKLGADIDLSAIDNLKVMGSETEVFDGSLNGDGYTIYNLNYTNFGTASALFHTIGEGGKVYNLNIKNIKVEYGVMAGSVAVINNGLIENIVVGAESTANGYDYDGESIFNTNSLVQKDNPIYYGGIVAKNYGEIIGCKNYCVISPRSEYATVYSGGIAGYNNGIISKCGNYNNVGGLNQTETYSVYSGGITAENNGAIYYSMNVGNVFASQRKTTSVYAGGIAALNNKEAVIDNCYNNNSSGISQDGTYFVAGTMIYAKNELTTTYTYIGGLVGYNEGRLQNCNAISNIQYSANENKMYIGKVFGQSSVASQDYVYCIYYYTCNDSKAKTIGYYGSIKGYDIYGDSENGGDKIISVENFILTYEVFTDKLDIDGEIIWKIENNKLKLAWED